MATVVLEERLDEWKQVKGSDWDRSVTGVIDENAELGRAVAEDFAGARVLDRMLMYERRIESSLYRTMAELRREREARPAAEAEGASRSESSLPPAQESATPAKLASFGTTPMLEGMPRVEGVPIATCQVSSDSSDFPLRTSHFTLEEKITPDGVTTNEEGRATRSGAETLHDRSCETKPIPREFQV